MIEYPVTTTYFHLPQRLQRALSFRREALEMRLELKRGAHLDYRELPWRNWVFNMESLKASLVNKSVFLAFLVIHPCTLSKTLFPEGQVFWHSIQQYPRDSYTLKGPEL